MEHAEPTTSTSREAIKIYSAKGLATFHCFQDLPKEIRIKIWKLAASSPRIIAIHYSSTSDECYYGGFKQHGSIFKPCYIMRFNISRNWNTSPALRQVCIESRSETLEFYKLGLGTFFNLNMGGHEFMWNIPAVPIEIGKYIVYLSHRATECPQYCKYPSFPPL
jgi:hypothetical protein